VDAIDARQASSLPRRLFMAVNLANLQLLVSVAIILAWLIAIVVGPFLVHWNPVAVDVNARLQPPSDSHWFGTDPLGRDLLSRVLTGGRTSLPAGAAVVALGAIFGTSVGLVAGYVGGLIDEGVMRITDMVLAFPTVILAMAVAAALGPGVFHGVLALSIVWWPQYARISRGLVLGIRHREFVLASTAAGSTEVGTLIRVIVPNVMSPLVILGAFDVGRAKIGRA